MSELEDREFLFRELDDLTRKCIADICVLIDNDQGDIAVSIVEDKDRFVGMCHRWDAFERIKTLAKIGCEMNGVTNIAWEWLVDGRKGKR